MKLGPHTITLLRAAEQPSDYGNTSTLDWSNATRTDVAGCSVQPSSSSEFTIDRDTFITRFVVYAPASTDVRASDRVEWDGSTYDIDGDVLRWTFGALSHVVINLSRSDEQ
jgi:hypothetical protein